MIKIDWSVPSDDTPVKGTGIGYLLLIFRDILPTAKLIKRKKISMHWVHICKVGDFLYIILYASNNLLLYIYTLRVDKYYVNYELHRFMHYMYQTMKVLPYILNTFNIFLILYIYLFQVSICKIKCLLFWKTICCV